VYECEFPDGMFGIILFKRLTLTRTGIDFQNRTLGMISCPSFFFTNFMNTAPTIKYRNIVEKNLEQVIVPGTSLSFNFN